MPEFSIEEHEKRIRKILEDGVKPPAPPVTPAQQRGDILKHLLIRAEQMKKPREGEPQI